MINYRLPGTAQRAFAFGGGLTRCTPGMSNPKNPIANRHAWDNDYASFPVGTRQGALIYPMKDGGIAARVTGSSDLTAGINGLAEGAATVTGSASVSVAAYGLTALRQAAANVTGSSSVAADINGLGNMASTINVSQLTSEDVNGAVLDALIEDGVTLKQALRLLMAIAAGKTSIDGSTVTFRDINDTKDRAVGEMTGSERTDVTLDLD